MPIPSDYPGMTADQLDGYIADFLTAIYGEEVRDKFARIAYLIGHQIPAEAEEVVDNAKESATAASLAAEEASDHAAAAKKSEVAAQQYMTTASEHVVKAGEYRTEAADSAAESQTNADQAYNWNQNCLTLYHQTQNLTNQVESYVEQILGVGYHVKIITESEYENLDTGFDPNTLYIVLESTYNPLDSLVSYYPLTSDLTDYLNNAKVGQAIGCLGFGDWDHSGSSFYMKRTDSVPTATKRENYISLPNDFLEGINFSNGATFVIRCKPDKAVSAGNGDWTRIFNFYKHASSAPNDGEGEVYLTQGLIGTWYYNAQSVQYLDTAVAGALAANQWHTVALVIEPIKSDNAHVKVSVFVDYRTIGSTQGVFAGTHWLNKVDQNWIGASRFDDDDFTGMVKDFRVYNKALSDSELTNVRGSNLKWRLRWNGGQDESFSDLDKKIQDILDGTTNLPYLKTSGGTMAGNVDMDGNALTGLPNPAEDTDAIPKGWADGQYSPLTAAIRPTVTGNPITVTDSAEAPVQGLCVYGKTTQDGTPSPENPVPLVSAEDVSVTVCGANLLDLRNGQSGTAPDKDVEYTAVGDGSYTRKGVPTNTIQNFWIAGDFNEDPADPETEILFELPPGTYTVKDCILFEKASAFQNTFTIERNTFITAVRAPSISSTGTEVDDIIYPMLNAGSTALPWEPYTGKTITLTGDLPGIPVDSGRNYTDPDGQQWVCNYRDWGRGVDVQMVKSVTVSTSHEINPSRQQNTDYYAVNLPSVSDLIGYAYAGALSNRSTYAGTNAALNGDQFTIVPTNGVTVIGLKKLLVPDGTVEAIKAYFNEHPVTIYYICDHVETPIPAEELAAYKALQTYDGTTNVTATDGAGLSLRYVADTQRYVDNKIAAISAAMLEG